MGRIHGSRTTRFPGRARRPMGSPGQARLRRLLFGGGLLLLGMALMGSLPGEDADPGELPLEFPPPDVQVHLSHTALARGETATLLLELQVAPTFHIQINDFLELYPLAEAPLAIQPWMAQELQTWHDEQVIAGRTILQFPIMIDEDAPLGRLETSLGFGYQGCVEEPTYACYPPGEVEIPLAIEVLPAGSQGMLSGAEIFATEEGRALAGDDPAGRDAAVPAESDDLAARIEGLLASGSALVFVLVLIGGILGAFTPCVLPMIPITISIIGGFSRSRVHGFILSLLFVLGIAITYSVLGVVSASAGSFFGAAMQSTAVMVVIAIVFAAMGASMLGAFDIALPAGVQSRLSAGSQKGGMIGAVVMGMVTGVVASPCVGPVLVALLTFVAKTGNVVFGFWLLFTFAVGLGLPFLVLGTTAAAIVGPWMSKVKYIFGIVLIAMAIFFVRGLLGPEMTRLITGVYLVLVGVFLGALTPLPEEPSRGRMFGKGIGILVFLSGTLLFLLWLAVATGAPAILGLGGGPLGAGGPGGQVSVLAHPGPDWKINDEMALQDARELGKPAVQDFYADWCGACVELDEKTWIDPAIIGESKRFVNVKMDFTKGGDFQKEAIARYQVKGMPTVIFYDSQGNEAARFVGFKPPDQVLKIMQSIE
ncbi:MAG: thioredoxin fold domain-containing protein [Candidatus Eisenbacteria bacterium]|nr:thioredoxin fold domain-containing protein [Candidatus Eisenbacteria bacterium]